MKALIVLSILASALLVGCGSSDSDYAPSAPATKPTGNMVPTADGPASQPAASSSQKGSALPTN